MGLEKIAEYKKRLGMTAEELSNQSGVPLGTLNKILSGATKDPGLNKPQEPSYNDLITVYTRSKKNLSQEEKNETCSYHIIR